MSDLSFLFLSLFTFYTVVVLAVLGKKIHLKITRDGFELSWNRQVRE